MSSTATGHSYVMVSKTGQVYAYGDAVYQDDSPGGLSGDIADISYTPGAGYILISTTGQHYAYATPRSSGTPPGLPPASSPRKQPSKEKKCQLIRQPPTHPTMQEKATRNQRQEITP